VSLAVCCQGLRNCVVVCDMRVWCCTSLDLCGHTMCDQAGLPTRAVKVVVPVYVCAQRRICCCPSLTTPA
jgi:hypothetical protein